MYYILISTLILVFAKPFGEAYEYETRITRTHPMDKGVRFGYQNPIRVAPTLSSGGFPTANYDQNYNIYPSTSARPPIIPDLRCKTRLDPNGREIQSRIDKRTLQCVELGSIEPCGQQRNMAFYAAEDEIYGECDCDQSSRRPLVYHEKTDTCYFVYQQAYCRPNEWLVFDNNRKPTCQDNPCRSYGATELQWDWTQNRDAIKMNIRGIVPLIEKMQCVPLGSVCQADGTFTLPGIDENQRQSNRPVLTFQTGDLKPTCIRNQDLGILTSSKQGVQLMECRPGSKLNTLGRC